MLNFDEFTVIDSDTDAVCAAAGVPEIPPALESASPAGRLPDASDHVYPGVPPLALSDTAYGDPTCAAPSVTEFATSFAGVCVAGVTTIDSVTLFCCVGELVSVTVSTNVYVP